MGGFECSCHALETGKRLDLLEATEHARFVWEDYARLLSLGMKACRDGISWVKTESSPGKFEFSQARSMIQAADTLKMQVAWDLMHFGWPLRNRERRWGARTVAEICLPGGRARDGGRLRAPWRNPLSDSRPSGMGRRPLL